MRKSSLVNGEIYHVMNKSIAGFVIFGSDKDYIRMRRSILYYSLKEKSARLCDLLRIHKIRRTDPDERLFEIHSKSEHLVQIIAYCIMPTHIHLVVRQRTEKGVQIFMSNLSNSYARYFNLSRRRKGPLWVGRFKSVLVESDDQLLHLTRYVHLNPTSAGLVRNPSAWPHSSFSEYTENQSGAHHLCRFKDVLDINPKEYARFVKNYRDTQRELATLKN